MSFSSHVCVFCFTLIADTQAQESTLGGGVNRHCFYGLQPDSDYKISVYTKLQEIEGPSVSIMQRTRKSNVFWFPSSWSNSTLIWLCIFPLFKKVVAIAAQEYGQCTFFFFNPPQILCSVPILSPASFLFHSLYVAQETTGPSDGKRLETMIYIMTQMHKKHSWNAVCETEFEDNAILPQQRGQAQSQHVPTSWPSSYGLLNRRSLCCFSSLSPALIHGMEGQSIKLKWSTFYMFQGMNGISFLGWLLIRNSWPKGYSH